MMMMMSTKEDDKKNERKDYKRKKERTIRVCVVDTVLKCRGFPPRRLFI